MKGGGIAAAENDFIVIASGATEGAVGVVICIAVGLGALPLEKLGIISRTAIVRIIPRAAISRFFQISAGVLASIGNPEFRGAAGSYVAATGDCLARRVGGYDRHWQVESIDERDVIGLITVLGHRNRVFSQCISRTV